jgi:hypothetical protein
VLLLTLVIAGLLSPTLLRAGQRPEPYWNVDDVQTGMKGVGRTVMHGTKVESFEACVLGVLKNVSPGRDMILCQLSGLNLEKTGVIAGMSGSPVYIDGRLLGAVAFTWSFGKEPIAGITPFSQMHGFVEAYERRDLADKNGPTRISLNTPVKLGRDAYSTVTVSEGFERPSPTVADGIWMTPLRTPLAATGFSQHALDLLGNQFRDLGLLPMQGGAAGKAIVAREKNTPLEPGGPLAVALITGDFDLSGIGTVTHIEGRRVYGWGHPFYGLGACEFPLMTGYIHTIFPRQSVSFKFGSPLRTVGVINADVSTGIAGWLERKPELLPIRMSVRCCDEDTPRVFQVQTVKQRALLPALVFAALTNSVDMHGDLPEELTAQLEARIEVQGHPPVLIKDVFSGSYFGSGRAPQALFNQISGLIHLLLYNSYKPIQIKSIDCDTRIVPGRRTAEIESVELDSALYAPGDTVKAGVYVRPYKGVRQRLAVSLKLPLDLPEGNYSAHVTDDLANALTEMRDNPVLGNPQSLEQVFETLKVQTDAKRTNLVLRVPVHEVGVALEGKSLRNLPPSMVQILGDSRRTGAQTISGALVARLSTQWVIQGSESVRFTVTKNKKLIEGE